MLLKRSNNSDHLIEPSSLDLSRFGRSKVDTGVGGRALDNVSSKAKQGKALHSGRWLEIPNSTNTVEAILQCGKC